LYRFSNCTFVSVYKFPKVVLTALRKQQKLRLAYLYRFSNCTFVSECKFPKVVLGALRK
jgi:hypothetical protein